MGRTGDIESEGVLRSFRVLLVVACLLLTVACTGWAKKSPPTAESQSETGMVDAEPAPVSPPGEASVSPEAEAKPTPVPAEQRPPRTQSADQGALAKRESAPAKPPTPVPEPAQKAATAAEPAKPPLDLDALETRLKETRAIGLFTKLALKNQVDDLLEKFRALYQGRSNTTLAQLRQPYEMLIMKVLALLQDGDPPLANDILASREAIWKILTDPDKFATL